MSLRNSKFLRLISACRKSNKIKKVAQINSTDNVSSTFSKVAGSRGGAPRRPPQRAKSPYFKKTEQGVRNAKAFRGEAYKTASPFNIPKQAFTPKRSGGTFWTKQLSRAFCTTCTSSISFFDRLMRPSVWAVSFHIIAVDVWHYTPYHRNSEIQKWQKRLTAQLPIERSVTNSLLVT